MTLLYRRPLLGAGATVASALVLRKLVAAPATPGNDAAPDADPGLGHLQAGSNDPVPPIEWRLPDGTVQTLADYAGKAVVLNMWATWCAPCIAEMPALDGLSAALRSTDAVVLPLSSDRGGAAAVQRWYEAHGITHLPVLLDPAGAAARTLGARGIPTTLLIDPHGRERGRLEGGADWASPQSVEMVKALARG